MQQTQWVSALIAELPDCAEQAAHTLYYAANRMSCRRFVALWEMLFPRDHARANRLWVTARERTKRADAAKAREGRAKRRGYYLGRKAEQEEARRAAMQDAKELAGAMRARSMGNGVDPDREGEFPVIPRRRGRRLTH